MKVYLGADHAGYHLKEKVFAHLSKLAYEVEDDGNKEDVTVEEVNDVFRKAADEPYYQGIFNGN